MEVTFSKNSWHRKFQKWAWVDQTPDFFSLCPYFWFTVLTLILTVTLIIPLIKLCIIAWNAHEKMLEATWNQWLDNLSLEEIGQMYEGKLTKRRPFAWERLELWALRDKWFYRMLNNGMSRDEITNKIQKSREEVQDMIQKIEDERKAEEEAKEAKKQRLQKNMAPLVLWTKRITFLFLTIVGMAVLTWLINFAVMTITLAGIGIFFTAFLAAVVILGIIVGVGALISNYVKSCKERGHIPYALRPFVWLWSGISAFFLFFFDYLKTNKNDYCPAINWEE